MSDAPLWQVLLPAVTSKANDDEILAILAQQRPPIRPPLNEIHIDACIDSIVLRERGRLSIDEMVERISPKRYGGKSAPNAKRVVSLKITAITREAKRRYAAMTQQESDARHAWLMKSDGT